MLKTLTINHATRVAHIKNGAFVRVLGPGRHRIWTLGAMHEFISINLREPVQVVDADDVLPRDLAEAPVETVKADERLLVLQGGMVTHVVEPGQVRIWSVPGLEVLRVRLSDRPVALADGDRWHARRPQWVELSASRSRALVLLRDGEPVELLEQGRYRFWAGSPWTIMPVSRELQQIDLAAQDLLTRDSVAVRLKPAASWRVTEPLTFVAEPKAQDLVYLAVQLALRKLVSERTLDELLGEKDALSDVLVATARAHLPEVGVGLETAAIKDVILPGEMKELLNRVTLARKDAEAKAIFRREEVAQTRQLANTAKLLENNPVLLRLKEIEAMGELVSKIDKLVVVGGGDLARQVLLREPGVLND